jgi:hypothetical protein
MKKIVKKLSLHRETLISLDDAQGVVGGAPRTFVLTTCPPATMDTYCC